MSQIGRILTDAVDGIVKDKRYPIHNGDPLFTAEFLETLAELGVKSVKSRPAYAERSVRSIKESRLEGMIFFGKGSLRTGIREFVGRNHQGPGNQTAHIHPMLMSAK
jgi:hypothetical protein